MEFKTNANRSQIPGLLLFPKIHYTVDGRGAGKSFGMGFHVDRLIRFMPRGVFPIVGATYGQILNNTLPSTLKALSFLGYEKGIDYVIGKKPPNWYDDSYEILSSYDNVVSFCNGVRFPLVSQSEPSSQRGKNADGAIGDELLTLDPEKLNYELIPTIRGNDEFFGKCPLHKSQKYSSSMPVTKKQRWILEKGNYYEEEAGIPIFAIWNRIVKMQIELLSIDNLKQFTEAWNEIERVRKQIQPFISNDGILFTLSNAFDNITQLGLSYIKDNMANLPYLIFLCEIMNFIFDKVQDCFYSINEEKQLYYTGLNDKKLLEIAKESNFNFDLLTNNTSDYDNDCNASLPIEIVPDWGGKISLFSVSQERNYDFVRRMTTQQRCQTFINEFFVKPNENSNILIKELCGKFMDYYRSHGKKVIHFYRDRYGDSRNPNVINSKSFNQQAVEYLKKGGWEVREFTHRGMEPPMSDKYLLWGLLLKEECADLPLIRFNANKCKYTLISMNNAMLKDENGKLSKDKSSERANSGVLPEEATHFSDAVDKIVWTKYSNVIKKESLFIPYRF